MSGRSFDTAFATLDSIRRDLARLSDLTEPPAQTMARQFLGIDLLARDLLLTAVRQKWSVPEKERRLAVKDRTLPFLVSITEQYAPLPVSRELLARIRTVHHHIRNAVEHRGYQLSLAECLEYLEAVESLSFSIVRPTLPSSPPDVLEGLYGYTVAGTYELALGQVGNPWYVVHASRPLKFGAHHLLQFWRYGEVQWQRVKAYDIGEAYLATVHKIATRTPIQEELLVWRRLGESMGLMSYDVLAVDGTGVVRLLAREGVPGAYVVAVGTAIEEHAGGRVVRYKWDGSAYVGQRVIKHSPAPLEFIDIYYSVLDGKVAGPSIFNCSVGQVFRLLRNDFESVVVRQLYSATGVVESMPDGNYQAVKAGETEISLVPNVYDWEGALRIKVIVVDRAMHQPAEVE